jgi:copper chaperone CopZ
MQRALLVVFLGVTAVGLAPSAQEKKVGKRPPVTLTYYLPGIAAANERAALRTALEKVKSMKTVVVAPGGEWVTVQFDSHVVSYHEVAQAITDAGAALGKQYAPRLKLQVPEYARNDNASKVDAIFAKKRLNQRVRIESVDKSKGAFVLHFLPLQRDPEETGPQGFNGGHLNHPIHDAPPQGLGLVLIYVTEGKGQKNPEK